MSVTISPLVPFGSKPDRTADTSAVALYGMAFLGPPGTVQGVDLQSRQGCYFASINLLFSASALPTANGKDYDVMGNLQRLHAHVTLTPLDSLQRPLAARSALEVLAALPDTMLVAAAPLDSASSHVGVAALNALTRFLVPGVAAGEDTGRRVGPALATFLQLYHRPSGRLQVGYISSPREFGWVWYGRDQVIVEGVHHASAALELGPAARFVRVHITLSSEWRSHGAWQRDVNVVRSTGGAPPG
ncbi:MAG: hypothetical protein ACYC7F_01095 [Gemmatimonadaceae bacterium]